MNTMDIAAIGKALGDSNRLQIVQMLSDGEKCGCKLLEAFENRHAMMCLLFLKDHSCCYRMNCSKERMEVTS